MTLATKSLGLFELICDYPYNSFFCHIKFFKPEIAEVISNDYHEIPPRLQLQLILTLIGKSNEEIAKILAISPSTIRVNKYRIKYYKK